MIPAPLNSDAVPTPSVAPIAPKAFGLDHARHLLWRAGFGASPAQVRTVAGWGLDRSLDYLINFDKVKDEPVEASLFRSDIIRPPTPEERELNRRAQRERDEDTLAELRLRRQQAEREDREQMKKLQQWWLTKMVETSRPLQEKLTLFWHGHFATSYRTIEDSYHMFAQNRLFRKHAAGSFADLLGGIIKDPAMIAYLDNNDSKKSKPNENLARELMELFALGVGNYTEQDIKEAARALTGYTFKDDEFILEKNNHDTASKRILGRTGNIDGDELVAILLAQPPCSTFLATKLYRFFVHDYPTGNTPFDNAAKLVISDMAQRLRATRFNVGKTLDALFRSEHFYSPTIMNQQIKGPAQMVVGAIRSMGVPPRDISVLSDAAERMGQTVFAPPSVKGWDGGRSWVNTSTMFVRQNLMVFLLTGRRPQGKDALADRENFQGALLLAGLAETYPEAKTGQTADMLTALLRFTVGTPTPAGRPVLEEYLADTGNTITPENLTDLMMLVTALPEYQLC